MRPVVEPREQIMNGSSETAVELGGDRRPRTRLLYVGDHRDSVNWGGRGQSIALKQLLARRFEISGVVPGGSVLSVERNDGYVHQLLPEKYFSFLRRMQGKSRLVDWYLRLEELHGARDFVTQDPEASAKDLIRYKATRPGLCALFDAVEGTDVVAINGEGSGVFATPFRRDFFFHLAVVELAALLGKKVLYINGIIADCPFTGRNAESFAAARKTLAKCRGVLVRDPESLELLRRDMPDVKSAYIPDALFSWYPILRDSRGTLPANGDAVIPPPEKDEFLGRIDFSRPYVCVGGSSWSANHPEKSVAYFCRLVEKLLSLGMPVYLTQNCGGDHFLEEVAARSGAGFIPVTTPIILAGAILGNASVFVSGRFHATIFASLGGTPCVFLGAHSHKMTSLQRTLEYEGRKTYSVFPTEGELDEIVAEARSCVDAGSEFRSKIQERVARRCDEATRIGEAIESLL